VIEEFGDFALKGNPIELAVASILRAIHPSGRHAVPVLHERAEPGLGVAPRSGFSAAVPGNGGRRALRSAA